MNKKFTIMLYIISSGRGWFISVFILITTVLPLSSKSQVKPISENIDWIFIIDTSKSMRGVGAENVFARVKDQVEQFVHQANEDDTIVVYTFDETTQLIRNVLIRNSLDRQDLLDGLDALKAEGDWTHTGDAVQKALDRSKLLRSKYTDLNREVAIVLFTDDKEDHNPKISSPFLSEIPVSKQGYRPFTFVIYLNKKDPPKELLDFVDKMGDRGYFKKYSTPSEIAGLRDVVLTTLPPVITVTPTALSFGTVEPGDSTSSENLKIFASRATSLKVRLESVEKNEIVLDEPKDTIRLEKGDNSVSLRLRVAPSILNVPHSGKIVFNTDEAHSQGDKNARPLSNILAIDFSVDVSRVSLTQRLLMWSGILAGIIALAWAGTYVITGEHPYESWRNYFYLEGELLIVKPHLEGLNNSISLRNEGKSKTRLSTVQGGILKEYLNHSDAELKTIHKNGEKFASINRITGNMYVQDKEVANEDLYDEDIIQIDGLTLMYRGGPERDAIGEGFYS